eukprot:scaffold224064_cov47-Attheya_sp.AAC.1
MLHQISRAYLLCLLLARVRMIQMAGMIQTDNLLAACGMAHPTFAAPCTEMITGTLTRQRTKLVASVVAAQK